jgi:hypothetical protein
MIASRPDGVPQFKVMPSPHATIVLRKDGWGEERGDGGAFFSHGEVREAERFHVRQCASSPTPMLVSSVAKGNFHISLERL